MGVQKKICRTRQQWLRKNDTEAKEDMMTLCVLILGWKQTGDGKCNSFFTNSVRIILETIL